MLYTGIILAPTIRADALTDLGDLKIIINSAASTIGSPTNSSRNWGFWSPPSGAVGTADLINNITTTILKDNYNLGLNQTQWLNVTSDDPNAVLINLTETGLDEPYIEYVTAISNLSAACIALGRSWHREMNNPVREALDGLQQGINTFSTSLLSAGLIHSNSTLRTIRASGTLEDAQQAWSRILNLPGSSQSPSTKGQERGRAQKRDDSMVPDGPTLVRITYEEAQSGIGRMIRGSHQRRIIKLSHFTHQQLWGREPLQEIDEQPKPYDDVQQQERTKIFRFQS